MEGFTLSNNSFCQTVYILRIYIQSSDNSLLGYDAEDLADYLDEMIKMEEKRKNELKKKKETTLTESKLDEYIGWLYD